MPYHYVVIGADSGADETLPVNTPAEIAAAEIALRDAGESEAVVWALPAAPQDGRDYADSVETSLRIWPAPGRRYSAAPSGEADAVGPFAALPDALTWAQNNGTADWAWFEGHSTERLARYAYHHAEGQSSDELLAAYLTACGEDPRDYSIGR
jgi:hypothetical protein